MPRSLLAVALCLLVQGGDGIGAAMTAYREGRFAAAVVALQAAIAARGGQAPAELHLDLAAAALAAGQLDVASDAVTTAAAAPHLQAPCAFVAAGIAWQRGEALVALARQVEAEPFAWRTAFAQLEAALAGWQQAASTSPDWPAARRNAERAVRRLADWRREQQAQLDARRRQAGAEARPLLVPDGQAGSEGEQRGGGGTTTQDNPLAPLRTELSAAAVGELFSRVQQKDQQKRALRRSQREAARAAMERDW